MSASVVGVGASGLAGGANPTINAGRAAGDVHVLFTETASGVVTNPGGSWVTGPAVANAAGTTKLSTHLVEDAGGAGPGSPTLAGGTDHVLGIVLTVRGLPLGDVLAAIIEWAAAYATAASVTGFCPSVKAREGDVLVVQAIAAAVGAASDIISAWTNATLTGFTKQAGVTTNTGNGGSIGIATGTLAAAGETGLGTITMTSTTFACLTLVLRSAPATPYTLDVEVQDDGGATPAPDGTPFVVWDLVLGVRETTGVVAGGAGLASVPVRFNDANRYLVTVETGAKRGCSEPSEV